MGKWIQSKGYKYETTAPYTPAQNVMASLSSYDTPLAMKFKTLGWTWPVIYLNVIVHAFGILMTWEKDLDRWYDWDSQVWRHPVLLNDSGS